MDTNNETPAIETETEESRVDTLMGVLEVLRATVKEGGPAYERIAEGIERNRQEEIDSLVAEAMEEEEYADRCEREYQIDREAIYGDE